MNTIRHVWFDLAGTLYKETAEFQILHDKFRYQTYAKLTNVSDPGVAKKEFDKLYGEHGSNSAVFRSLGQSSDYWMQAIESMDFNSVLQPDREITQTLEQLRNIVPISLFTNFPKTRLVTLLSHLEIPREYFTHILTGDDIKERKPALDGFHLMIKESALPSNQILYIGDRIDVDIKPAKSVGILAGLLYGEAPDADFCFSTFSDILNLFSNC